MRLLAICTVVLASGVGTAAFATMHEQPFPATRIETSRPAPPSTSSGPAPLRLAQPAQSGQPGRGGDGGGLPGLPGGRGGASGAAGGAGGGAMPPQYFDDPGLVQYCIRLMRSKGRVMSEDYEPEDCADYLAAISGNGAPGSAGGRAGADGPSISGGVGGKGGAAGAGRGGGRGGAGGAGVSGGGGGAGGAGGGAY